MTHPSSRWPIACPYALFVFLLAGAIWLPGCPVKAPTQLVEPSAKAFVKDPTKKGHPRWIFRASARIVSTPAVGVNTIYVGSLDRKLFAVDSRTGKKKWVFGEKDEMDDLVLSSPATNADGSVIYIASKDNRLYAVSDAGKPLWSFSTQGSIDSSPKVGLDGTIFVASHDQKLYALPANPTNKKRPTPIWVYRANEKFRGSSPEFSVAGNLIYIGDEGGNLHAVSTTKAGQANKQNDKTQWVKKLCDKITSSPKADTDGTIYISCWGRFDPTRKTTYTAEDKLKGEIKAIDAQGKVKWTVETDGPVLASPQIGRDGNIYVGSDDGYFYAIDKNGNQRWKFQTGLYQKDKKKAFKHVSGTEGYIQATAAISPQTGIIFFGSINEYLYAVNPKGKLVWQFDARGWVDNAPVIHGKGDIIYVAAGDRLFAMNP
jgi:outer membrane protein assembly factor BamB